MLKTIIVTLGLLIPSTAPTNTIKPGVTEVGVSPLLQHSQVISPIKEPSVKFLSPLPYAPFHFDPMGTHPNAYEPLNCTWGAASMKGNIPNWGNANTWDDDARAAGYTVSDVPVLGAVAQTDRGYYGHVAVVTKIDAAGTWITEMNYDSNGGVRTRLATPGEFMYIYI